MKTNIVHQISCQESTSASFLTGLREIILIEGKVGALLSHGRVDTYTCVELLLGQAALECDTETLSNLSGVRGSNVESDNLVS